MANGITFENAAGHTVSICRSASGIVHVWIDTGKCYYHGTAGYSYSNRCIFRIQWGKYYATDSMMLERIKNYVDNTRSPALIG